MCTGAASRQSADLECGQFDEAFVEALKGTCRGPNTGVPQKVEPITTER